MGRVEIRLKVEPGRIDIENGKIDAWFKEPGGPIARDMLRRANNVEATARFDSPRDTGLLAATHRSQMDFSGRLPSAVVLAGREGATPYVGYLIYGTAPHIIEAIPNRPNAHLRFVARGGNVVFVRRVQHPGTRPDNWLERALLRAAA